MTTYVLEVYVPRSDRQRLADLDAAAQGAAATLRRRGPAVRLIRSIYLPSDEICFLLVDTSDRAAAEEFGSDLGLAVIRLAEAITVPQG